MLDHIARILPQPNVNGVQINYSGGQLFLPPHPPTYALNDFVETSTVLWFSQRDFEEESEWTGLNINFHVGFGPEPYYALYIPRVVGGQSATHLILYFHDSDEDLAYGHCRGISSGESLRECAESTYLFAVRALGVPSNRIICWGKGIGACAAIIACSQSKAIAALVLQNPLVPDESQSSPHPNGWRVASKIFEDNFEADIRLCRAPSLFLNESGNGWLPKSSVRALFKRSRAHKKFLHERQTQGQNLPDFEFDVLSPVEAFLDTHIDQTRVVGPLHIKEAALLASSRRDQSPPGEASKMAKKFVDFFEEKIASAKESMSEAMAPNPKTAVRFHPIPAEYAAVDTREDDVFAL